MFNDHTPDAVLERLTVRMLRTHAAPNTYQTLFTIEVQLMKPLVAIRNSLGVAVLVIAFPAPDVGAEESGAYAGAGAQAVPGPAQVDDQSASAAGPNAAPAASSASVTTYSPSCYECTTVNFNHRLFTSLESAQQNNSDPVILESCHQITGDECQPLNTCATTTLCGVDPHSTTAACAFDGCVGCHLYATCIDETGHCRPEQYVDCGASDVCADVATSGSCGF